MANIQNIELRRLRHVIEVGAAGSISVAAGSLGISQPALSRSIALLEYQIGIQLFERVRRGTRLTDEGELFVAEAKKIIGNVEDLISNTEDYLSRKRGRLKIGVAPAGFQRFLSRPVQRMVKAYPGIRIEIVSGSAEELAPKVIGGELDVIWGSSRPLSKWPELSVTIVGDLHTKCMVRKGHPLTKTKNPIERDLLLFPVILPASVEPPHIDLAKRYAPNRLPPLNAQYITDDFEVVRRIVSETDAFSLVSSPINKFEGLTDEYEIFSDLLKIPDQRLAIGVHTKKLITPALETFEQCLNNSPPATRQRKR